MKAELLQPVHKRSRPGGASYRRHRSQLTSQIILPMVLTAVLFVALVVMLVIVTFSQSAGNEGLWADVSTIWIVLLIMIAGLPLLVLLLGMIYLLAQLLGIVPMYTNRIQDFIYKLSDRIQHAADVPVRPILFVNGIGAAIKTFFGRK